MTESALLQRFDRVYASVAKAAAASGRKPEEVSLIAVSKKHPAEKIVAVARHWSQFGHPAFGESYMQEVLAKQVRVAELLQEQNLSIPLDWHFIGHIQSKKCKDIVGKFCLIHSISSVKLASAMHAAWKNRVCAAPVSMADPAPLPQRVLIQVNIGREEQKSGIMPENLDELTATLATCPGLALEGLMCLPPATDTPEQTRPYFAAMRELRDAMRQQTGLTLPHLSMGMSNDFAVAIEEGATLVRVGTDIFGAREA